MKKSILNLGKSLNKTEQKLINGGHWACENVNKCYQEYGQLETEETGYDPVFACINGYCVEVNP